MGRERVCVCVCEKYKYPGTSPGDLNPKRSGEGPGARGKDHASVEWLGVGWVSGWGGVGPRAALPLPTPSRR